MSTKAPRRPRNDPWSLLKEPTAADAEAVGATAVDSVPIQFVDDRHAWRGCLNAHRGNLPPTIQEQFGAYVARICRLDDRDPTEVIVDRLYDGVAPAWMQA